MPEDIELSRRRVLGGLAAVGLGSAAAGAGTMAAFSDSESSTGNSVQAGTLDLTLDGASQTVTFLDTTGVKPGDTGSGSVELGNTGSVSGTVTVTVDAIRSTENGYYGKENGQDGSQNDGELDEFLSTTATVGSQTAWSNTRVVDLNVGQEYTTGATIGPNSTKTFTLDWQFVDEQGVNLAQSDGVELDLTFRLEQSGP